MKLYEVVSMGVAWLRVPPRQRTSVNLHFALFRVPRVSNDNARPW